MDIRLFNQSKISNISKDLWTDSYTNPQPKKPVIGTRSPSNVLRQGIDLEKTISIDHGALRFQPLIKPGWGRQGIAYGPYARQNGLAFSAFLLNGHNTSQVGDLGQSLQERLRQWIRGSQRENLGRRLLAWVFSHKNEPLIRRIWRWLHMSKPCFNSPPLDENLAVGWFPQAISSNPLQEGNGFVIRGVGPENGELQVRVGGNLLAAFKGLQNLQVYYIVILREKGAAYYAASIPKAKGLVAYPDLRPIALDSSNDEPTVYAAIHQSVLGQIGFSVDTRVYGVQVQTISELATWYGTAHAADCLQGQGTLQSLAAEVGGNWTLLSGDYGRSPQGLKPLGNHNLAILYPPDPSGLLHVEVDVPETVATFGILWRVQDEHNLWRCQITGNECELAYREQGVWQAIAVAQGQYAAPSTRHALQVVDDGQQFSLYLNGQLLLDRSFTDSRLQHASGIGLYVPEA
ncbi:MAG: hypothetical protein VKJ46_07015, partial [Leptolyngbyaceae bacterium]|nr:hypothetical protein [Leptolyngbyaceae bacterium]